MSYYNTTNLAGAQLKEARKQVETQDEIVLSLFPAGTPMAPSWILRRGIERGLLNERTPITGIRRSIFGLTKEGHLVKTDQKITGPYGKPEHCWQLAVSEPTQLRLI